MNTNFLEFLKPWNLIKITSTTPKFESKQGYVGEVFQESFEFKEVLNPYEHFSNLSEEPITKTYLIRFSNIKNITL